MAKKSRQYVCSNCGYMQSSWAGKCPDCQEWNTLSEIEKLDDARIGGSGSQLSVVDVGEVVASSDNERIPLSESQLSDLLGGGLVKGSVVLLAGQPGIGKSTLLMQIADDLSMNVSTLYVSGEESVHQVASRASRLNADGSKLKLTSSTVTDDIARTIASGDFKVVIVDSIQTVACKDITSSSGSVSQITNSTNMLSRAAKNSDTTLIMVGHVTKEGSIAGPKVLEHSVDVVLQLEGDRYGGFKVLRSVKNRYGSTNEAAIYEMTSGGLKVVENPSAALLEERQVSDGSVVLAAMEGSRPVLVEIQALVNTTSYGYPKRAASGFDQNRMNLLVAMLERRTKLKLSDKDIYINVVGGIDINEPAADLAICMAIASAAKGMQLKKNAVVFGELGLGGEVRHVPQVQKRVAEAIKLGFDVSIGPVFKGSDAPKQLEHVKNIREALNTYLEKN